MKRGIVRVIRIGGSHYMLIPRRVVTQEDMKAGHAYIVDENQWEQLFKEKLIL